MARDYNAEAAEMAAWLERYKDRAGTPEYQQVQSAHAMAKRLSGYREEAKTANVPEKFGIAADYLKGVAQDFFTAAGIKGVPTAAGQVAGGTVGQRFMGKPGRKVGEAIGGGIGAAAGSLAYQTGVRGDISGGELMTDIVAGATQPKNVLVAGAVGAGLDIARQKIDKGTVNLSEASAAGFGMAAGAAGARAMAGRSVSPADALMEQRRQIFEDVRKYDIVVNPASLSDEFSVATALGGKEAISSRVSGHNQMGWQKMGFEQMELDMPKNGLLVPTDYRLGRGKGAIKGTIDKKIEEVSKPYREVSALSDIVNKELEDFKAGKPTKIIRPNVSQEGIEAMKNAAQNLDEIKSIRFERKGLAKRAAMGDPEAKAAIRAMVEREKQLESQLELAASASGDETLMPRLREAREKIAVLKIYDDATTDYGTIDPAVVYSLRDAGAPTTGNLERMARFYGAFGKTGDASEIVNAGVQGSGGLPVTYATRAALEGNKGGIAAGGVPVVRGLAQEYLLAPDSQKAALRTPMQYNPEGVPAAFIRQAGAMGGMNVSAQPPDQASAFIRQMQASPYGNRSY